VGSNAPFVIDEAELDRRIAEPAIAGDLTRVSMGSSTDLLSYFVMGTSGMKRFGQKGALNTDDHPYLEFSAPFSIAIPSVMAKNVQAIAAQRESILPYLKPAAGGGVAREEQQERWSGQLTAGGLSDRALALFLGRSPTDPDFTRALRRLTLEYPEYAPGRALWNEYEAALLLEPRLFEQASFNLMDAAGKPMVVEISAVLVPVSKTRASIMFVDNRARTVYGQVYVDDYDREGRGQRLAGDVMAAMRAAYEKDAAAARAQQKRLPGAPETLRSIKDVVVAKVRDVQTAS